MQYQNNKLTFFTTVKGDNWLNTYLGVLLQSIDELYGDSCKIVVSYTDITPTNLEIAQRKLPYVEWVQSEFKDLPETGQYSNLMDYWNELIEKSNDEKIVFLDADMAIIKDILPFFNESFDVGYTYYDKQHGSAAYTSSGKHTRINSGTILINGTERARIFFKKWRDVTNSIISERKNKLVSEWGSADQAALASIFDTDDHSRPIVREGITLKGFSCQKLNETECRSITNDTHIIHYKAGWRPVLPDGTWDKVLPQLKHVRNKELCNQQYLIWKGFYERWNKR